MQRKKFHDIEWLEFDLLSDIPHLRHAVFLRHGGYSQGNYGTLNTGFHVGDDNHRVRLNIDKITHQFQSEIPNWNHLVWGRANHGKSIAKVTAQSAEEIVDVDGLVTSCPGVSLMMKHADCQVAIFYDTQRHAIANVHAGWRGSVANIYREAIEYMTHTFGSKPAELLVCISPSLGPNEAEFIHYQTELPKEFWCFQPRPTYFDFWSISEFQLQTAGILPHHIEIARLSTYSNSKDFFSYRRDHITGRHATCITLCP
ncbi:MAG: peptidoglycan editing factor PgeF [Parachlamydiaceae bacterium]